MTQHEVEASAPRGVPGHDVLAFLDRDRQAASQSDEVRDQADADGNDLVHERAAERGYDDQS